MQQTGTYVEVVVEGDELVVVGVAAGVVGRRLVVLVAHEAHKRRCRRCAALGATADAVASDDLHKVGDVAPGPVDDGDGLVDDDGFAVGAVCAAVARIEDDEEGADLDDLEDFEVRHPAEAQRGVRGPRDRSPRRTYRLCFARKFVLTREIAAKSSSSTLGLAMATSTSMIISLRTQIAQ